MLDAVLTAVAQADPCVLVGPRPAQLPIGVVVTREQPAGGGPMAAVVAGMAQVTAATPAPRLVLVLAADLPFLTVDAVTALTVAASPADVDAAVLVDGADRPQWLCACWSVPALVTRLSGLGGAAGVTALAMRTVYTGIRLAQVSLPSTALPPWYDCDTPADLARARQLVESTPSVASPDPTVDHLDGGP
jgi:molybdopterin-guanine dinucleotide biosynthesis protein A